jgi:hypothetical protein
MRAQNLLQLIDFLIAPNLARPVALRLRSISPIAMKTVQLALRDSDQANVLRDLLHDGGHQVYLVEHPDASIAGVIVMDFEHLATARALAGVRERVIVVTSRAPADLTSAWEAGIRHVVFQGDDPDFVRVAVLAMELTLTAES